MASHRGRASTVGPADGAAAAPSSGSTGRHDCGEVLRTSGLREGEGRDNAGRSSPVQGGTEAERCSPAPADRRLASGLPVKGEDSSTGVRAALSSSSLAQAYSLERIPFAGHGWASSPGPRTNPAARSRRPVPPCQGGTCPCRPLPASRPRCGPGSSTAYSISAAALWGGSPKPNRSCACRGRCMAVTSCRTL